MLEKMGWSKGKGLGMNEDGQQNFIRVSHKTDQKGMGFQDRDDQWTGHENDFNSLLKSLDNSRNASEEECEPVEEVRVGFGFGFNSGIAKTNASKSIKSKLSGKSLEEMSKSSSVRVHYRKFTRGKDISRYSEKDLANIFGKKIVNADETVTSTETSKPIDEVPESSYGITTIETGTTIHDYFTKKKRNKENANESEECVVEKKQRKKDKTPISDADVSFVMETIDVEEEMQPIRKEKKKKKSKKEPIVMESIVVSDDISDCEMIETRLKTKKNKKKNKSHDSQHEVMATGQLETEITAIDESNGTVEKMPKKKKRDKKIPSELSAQMPEVNANESIPISNTQFIDDILRILANNNYSGHSSTALKPLNVDGNDAETITTTTTPSSKTSHNIAMDEIFEINRYHAEMFRFVDLDGFPNANLSDLSGYGFSKEFELKISEKSKDQTKINDLWDHALIHKYGKDVIQAKKTKRYSMKHLKKKNLFMKL